MSRKLSDLAAKAAREPYVLELPDGTIVSVPQPTATQWSDAPFTRDVAAVLTALGVDEDDAARAGDAFRELPLGTADQFVVDMRDHFGLGN